VKSLLEGGLMGIGEKWREKDVLTKGKKII
jgi:hypothetical protein